MPAQAGIPLLYEISEKSEAPAFAGVTNEFAVVRQGVTGHDVRYVLFFNLASVIAAFVMLILLNMG